MTPTPPNPSPPPTHFCIHWRCSDGSAPERKHLPFGVDFDEACRTAREKAPRTARWVDVMEATGRHNQLVTTHRRWRSTGGGPFVSYSETEALREQARRKAAEVRAFERALDTADLVRVTLTAAGLPPSACEPNAEKDYAVAWWWRRYTDTRGGWHSAGLTVELRIDPAAPERVAWSLSGEPITNARKYDGFDALLSGEVQVVDGAVALPAHVLDVIRCVVMGAACPALRVGVARQDP